jgi:hypothetical protein
MCHHCRDAAFVLVGGISVEDLDVLADELAARVSEHAVGRRIRVTHDAATVCQGNGLAHVLEHERRQRERFCLLQRFALASVANTVPVAHGEGRFVAPEATLELLFSLGQVATQYVDFDGRPSMDSFFNPNGSILAIEGITSPDGRIFGKMAHCDRTGKYVLQNVPGDMDQKIFSSGVRYFK